MLHTVRMLHPVARYGQFVLEEGFAGSFDVPICVITEIGALACGSVTHETTALLDIVTHLQALIGSETRLLGKFWDSVRGWNDPERWEQYLQDYPHVMPQINRQQKQLLDLQRVVQHEQRLRYLRQAYDDLLAQYSGIHPLDTVNIESLSPVIYLYAMRTPLITQWSHAIDFSVAGKPIPSLTKFIKDRLLWRCGDFAWYTALKQTKEGGILSSPYHIVTFWDNKQREEFDLGLSCSYEIQPIDLRQRIRLSWQRYTIAIETLQMEIDRHIHTEVWGEYATTLIQKYRHLCNSIQTAYLDQFWTLKWAT